MIRRTQRPRHRWTDEELALLGTMPDEELALQIGATVAAVSHKRCGRNIPRFNTNEKAKSRSRA